MVEIVFAKKSDGEDILSFLDVHWQTGHVFTKDPGFFFWQHGLPGTDDLSFVLGREEGSGLILGILGYVPVARYDPDCTSGDFTLATWKVRDDCNVNGLGLFLFKALTKRMKPHFVGVAGLLGSTNGLSPSTYIDDVTAAVCRFFTVCMESIAD